jgi:hypothetical protein
VGREPDEPLALLGVILLGGLGILAALAHGKRSPSVFSKCKLRYLCGPGESYSDVILKRVELEAKGEL